MQIINNKTQSIHNRVSELPHKKQINKNKNKNKNKINNRIIKEKKTSKINKREHGINERLNVNETDFVQSYGN